MHHFTAVQQMRYGKIWGIGSAPNGIIYMAAEKGLVEFDGEDWVVYKGSAGYTRSVAVPNDSTIFTGSDLDFGIWKRDASGGFTYKSLYPFSNTVQQRNEEFWHTVSFGEAVAFASKDNIYLYNNNTVTRLAVEGDISGCFSLDNKLYVFEENRGLFVLTGASPELVATHTGNTPFLAKGLYRNNDKLVLVSQNLGLWEVANKTLSRINSPLSDRLAAETVFSFSEKPNQFCSFGTVRNGLYCATTSGNIALHLNKQKGLPNNTILSLHQSKNGRLWLGLDVGCSAVDITGSTTYVVDYSGNFGTPQTATLKNENFYLGTNQGLFIVPWHQLDSRSAYNGFSLVAGSSGQVWSLYKDNQEVLVGHDRGLFALGQNGLQSLGGEPGVWTMVKTRDNHLLTGQYNGIGIYSKSNDGWAFAGKMNEIAGSCSQLLLVEDSILWVCLPNYGIIRASLNTNYQPVNRLIFPDSLFGGGDLQIRMRSGGIVVIQNGKAFKYNKNANQFRSIGEVVANNSVDGLINNFGQAIDLDGDYQFFPVYNGFALERKSAARAAVTGPPMLRSIIALAAGKELLGQMTADIPFKWRNIQLKLALPTYPEAEYRYRLQKKDSIWSSWQSNPEIVLIGLEAGQYNLQVMARVQGVESEWLTIPFRIRPPWYASWYGYLLYAFLAAVIIILVRWRMQQKLLKQRQAMLQKQRQMLHEQTDKYNQKILLMEQQQLQQEKQQLSEQLKAKTIELASKAKDNADKAHLLEKIKTTFEEGLANPGRAQVRWAEIQRLLESNSQEEDRVFQVQMDELHQEFFKALKQQYEGLSVYDLRLCAYLKIGLSSAEIADLLKVQPSSVYISRSRLRKKLGLAADDDLFSFLNKIGPQP